MIIVVNCPGCKKQYELDGVLAGKKSRCRDCGEIFRIPVPTARVIEPAGPPALPPEPAAPRPSRESSLPPRRSLRNAETGTTIPAPAARAKPAPAAFDDDLPPPPRSPFPAAGRSRRRRSSSGGDEDSEIGLTAFGWVVLLSAIATIAMYLYLGLTEPDPTYAGRVYALITGITFLAAFGLCAWGNIWLICLAFREDVFTGLMTLFLPFYAFYFMLKRWHERRGVFVLIASPVLVVGINLALGWLVMTIRQGTALPSFARSDSEVPNVANDGQPQGNPPPAAQPNPAPVVPTNVAGSARKADAYQVRLAEQEIRQKLEVIKDVTRKLSTVHNVRSAQQVENSLRFQATFARVRVGRPANIDLGSNERLALKHRVGQEIRSAFTDFKNQVLRIQSIPELGIANDAAFLAEFDTIIDAWTIKPGEEAMPELVEPPPPANRFGPPGPRGGFAIGPPGMRRPFAPGMPRAFPPGMPGAFPPGMQPMNMSMNIVERMEQDYQTVRQEYGDRTAAILVTGFPSGDDPPPGDVAEAMSRRIKELAPEIVRSHWVRINDRFETVVAPVNDIPGMARRIDFGTVTVKDGRIEVQLDARWAANVPRKPAPPPRADEPQVPQGADAITRSMIELKSPDKGKRKRAVERLQRSEPDGRVDQVVGEILPLLEDDDGFFVSDVIKALAVWRSPDAMEALIGRLRENRHFVRSDAIKALGKYQDLRAAEAVVTVMKEDGFAVEDALKAMGEVAEPAVIPVLRSPDTGLRRQACKILAQIGGQKTLVEMQSLPSDPDFSVRVAAKDAWQKIVARVGPPPKPTRGKTGTSSGPASRR